ncbi:hypothetical protein G6L35_05985 [Agrobacterium tumefaciens]|uniref:hypothetical protein n=1 Tax=Agrobacterium tumefaciens TaxID=358 RepID=UPI001572ABE0|nr:hypothetical protein [Agrobacterium tumefaciens]NSZ68176.1 hypothetical protein [Agrobacterium tumefaciens]
MANNGRKRRTRTRPKLAQLPLRSIVPLPFPSGSPWDALLTTDQLRKLHWADKQCHVLESLRRKVAIVLEYAQAPSKITSFSKIPKSRKELREWVDPTRGLWPWTWPVLDNPDHPQNGEFIEVFWAALNAIETGPQDKRSNLQREIKDRDAVIAALKLQNTELLAENIALRKSVFGK